MFLDIPVIKIQPGSYETQLTKQVSNYFDKTINETKYYKEILTKMKPLMTIELNRKNDPRHLVKTVIKAMESKRPKLQYRVDTGKLLVLGIMCMIGDNTKAQADNPHFRVVCLCFNHRYQQKILHYMSKWYINPI